MLYSSPAAQVRILVNGKPIKVFTDNSGNSWVEAKEGGKYTIEIKNNGYKRILALASIDGINVISGKEATTEPENGYIVNAYSNLKIEGWRVSNDQVKQFIFTFDKKQSYSVKLGAGDNNLGVIGVMIFEEKEKSWSWTSYDSGIRFNGNANPSWINNCTTTTAGTGDTVTLNSCSTGPQVKHSALRGMNTADNMVNLCSVDFQAGTGKGKAVESKVTEVSFEPGSCIQTTTIYYDSYKNLLKRGIITQQPKMPQPFKNTGYCPDI